MKKNACELFAEELMTPGRPLTREAAEHAEHCPECAGLHAAAMRFAAVSLEQDVPEKLDRVILDHASAAVRERSYRHLLFRRWLPLGAAAAAAAVLCITVWPEGGDFAGSRAAAVPVLAARDNTGDWSAFEREAFDLNQELTSCQNVVAAWQTTTME